MSRIGKLPIAVTKNVEIKISDDWVTVNGPKGSVSQRFSNKVEIKRIEDIVVVDARDDSFEAKSNHGTVRAVLNNMIRGVVFGFERKLILVGVGYRAQAQGDVLNLSLGFSHPVTFKMPMGISVETPVQTEIIVKGVDKQKVGQICAEIRSYRPPEPYKGKGVRYSDEVVIIKETKKK